MEVHAFRLTPGEDLKKALCAYAASRKLRASFVLTCVGSLSAVTLRLANSARDGKNEVVSLDERFEIVSLTGTLSANGAHLHVSIADFAARGVAQREPGLVRVARKTARSEGVPIGLHEPVAHVHAHVLRHGEQVRGEEERPAQRLIRRPQRGTSTSTLSHLFCDF